MPRNEEGLPPEGEFDARVETTEIKPGPKFDFVEVGLTVFIEDGFEWQTNGRINLTDAAAGINRTFFHAIGFNPDEDVEILHTQPLLLKGNKTRVFVEHATTRNGDSYARVGRFLQPRLEINDKIRERLKAASDKIRAAKKENANG